MESIYGVCVGWGNRSPQVMLSCAANGVAAVAATAAAGSRFSTCQEKREEEERKD